ncbi:unnamed protein product, partial [Pocillopora meandrina]
CASAPKNHLQETMSGYKLYYLDARGRAEIIRLSFVAANMEYEDIRFTREEWVKEKESGRPPLGQVPFLVTPDGKVLGQSQAIMKYVCRIGGLSPTDSFDEAIADMIVGGVEDFFQALIKVFIEKEEAKKTELMKEFLEETLANRLPKYENILKANNEGKGFFVGDKLTYADIIFFDLMNFLEKGEPTAPKALEKFPLLAAHHKRVLDVPEIKKWNHLQETMSGYKLYYFDVRGRAEIVRLSFVAANMEYEDIRFTREEWVKEKECEPPLGQAPFLVTPDGKVLGQSQAIMKYVCRIGGLSPTDSFDEAIADMIVGGVEDFFQALIKAHMEKEEAKKTELMKEFFEETLANRLPRYENILKANNEGKGFFVGDKLTYADIIFFDLMNLLEKGEPTAPKALEKFPLLAAHHKRVLDVPGIKKWVETRPKTEH